MIAPVWPRWIRLVPVVGLIVLLMRWRQGPHQTGPADPAFREGWELTDAWVVTLGALLALTVILVFAELLLR